MIYPFHRFLSNLKPNTKIVFHFFFSINNKTRVRSLEDQQMSFFFFFFQGGDAKGIEGWILYELSKGGRKKKEDGGQA
jgi:hypothetical protein